MPTSSRAPDRLPYPQVEGSPDFPGIEREVLAYWDNDGTFEASVKARSAANEYVFYDGPPFANGMPHYGHLLTGFVKDAIPRYKTMRGWRVERRFGWDCHGLPAEMEAVKELGLPTRNDIQEYGIDRFNDYCRTSVLRYTGEWERYVARQARWVDFSNDYKTMDLSYMESVMWAFKQLHKKGLLYEGFRVLPYCWECETPLSNFETRQDNAYRSRQDPAVTIAFELLAPFPGGPLGRFLRLGCQCAHWFGPPLLGHCLPTWHWRLDLTSTTQFWRPAMRATSLRRRVCQRWPMPSRRLCQARSRWPRC